VAAPARQLEERSSMNRSVAFAITLFAAVAVFATACSAGDTTINSSTTTLAGINADGRVASSGHRTSSSSVSV